MNQRNNDTSPLTPLLTPLSSFLQAFPNGACSYRVKDIQEVWGKLREPRRQEVLRDLGKLGNICSRVDLRITPVRYLMDYL